MSESNEWPSQAMQLTSSKLAIFTLQVFAIERPICAPAAQGSPSLILCLVRGAITFL